MDDVAILAIYLPPHTWQIWWDPRPVWGSRVQAEGLLHASMLGQDNIILVQRRD